jgi:hypothetical protein
MGTSNEEGNEKVVLQNDEILTQLKATNGHITCNIILKRGQTSLMLQHLTYLKYQAQ